MLKRNFGFHNKILQLQIVQHPLISATLPFLRKSTIFYYLDTAEYYLTRFSQNENLARFL